MALGLSGLTLDSTAEFIFQSDIENYVTRGHIDFPFAMTKDGIKQLHWCCQMHWKCSF